MITNRTVDFSNREAPSATTGTAVPAYGSNQYVTVANSTGGSSASSTGSAGSGQAHNNMQPYVVARYIIKL